MKCKQKSLACAFLCRPNSAGQYSIELFNLKKEGMVTYSRKLIRLFVIASMLLLILIRDSFAYVDPGTGSYILQLGIACLLGVAFAVKGFWRDIKAFFSKLLSKG